MLDPTSARRNCERLWFISQLDIKETSACRGESEAIDIGLVGSGMGHKMESGCGIREILRTGYGMKISWRDRDTLISIGGMGDSFEIVGGMHLNCK